MKEMTGNIKRLKKVMEPTERILKNLKEIYEKQIAEKTYHQILEKLNEFRKMEDSSARYIFSEKDIVLITYADQFQFEGKKSLKGLEWFANSYLTGIFSTSHILPFFPYSSDDGFSVIDYYSVNPAFGDWSDIQALSKQFRLMFDGVFNHVSRESQWFQSFLSNDPKYSEYFITVSPQADLSAVMRPRTSELITRVQTEKGERYVWTTFSADQIDLNFANAEVLLEIIDVLLFYVKQGAKIIRIDAVPFLWKELGMDCIHRPQTHAIIKAFRAVLDFVAAQVVLITESNVPFIENISYLGNVDPENGSSDEAQLVYQFSLAPLVLHALISGDSTKLTEWVSSLPSPHNYFNFIASHDGIGLLPAQGILDDADIDMLIKRTKLHGGKLSYKTDTNGNQKVYELNITLYDFLNHPQSPHEKLGTARYLTSQVIMLELAGVPGVYAHSLFGSSNCAERIEQTKQPRMINREKFTIGQLKKDLCGETRSCVILEKYLKLISIRRDHSAFSPMASQRVLRLDTRVFSLLRKNAHTDESVMCISNMTSDAFLLEVDISELELPKSKSSFKDLLSGMQYRVDGNSLSIDLDGYQSLWLLLCSFSIPAN